MGDKSRPGEPPLGRGAEPKLWAVGQPITEIRDRQRTRWRLCLGGSDPPDHPIAFFLAQFGEEDDGLSKGSRNSHRRGAAMTDRSYEIPQDADLRNLARVVSACTLGLWAFATGLLIGVFLFS